MATGTRLAIGAGVVLLVTGYWAYIGASSSWQYYLTVDECVANLAHWQQQPVRVSGTIVSDTLLPTASCGSEQRNSALVAVGQVPELMLHDWS